MMISAALTMGFSAEHYGSRNTHFNISSKQTSLTAAKHSEAA